MVMVKLPYFTAAAAALGAAISTNVGQGLYGLHSFPDGPPSLPFALDGATPADLHALPRHKLVALWHHLDAAETPPSGRYDGTILPAGPLSPFSLFISHTLWNDAPRGYDRWVSERHAAATATATSAVTTDHRPPTTDHRPPTTDHH